MKLQQLPMGARFEYEGTVYVKTGPMTATAEQGGQRIIPRYATLRSLEAPAAEASLPTREGGPDRYKVRLAFEAFFDTCNRLVDQEGQEELAKARKRFLSVLD